MLMQAGGAALSKAEAWHVAFRSVDRLTAEHQARIARIADTTPRHVRRLYKRWLDGGRDAAALIDRRLAPERQDCALTPEFLEFWKTLCQENQRSSAAAYRVLRGLWRSGKPIPGISAEIHRFGDLPPGLSARNLRRHLPTAFELKAARIGRRAAAPYRPLNFTTRVGMEVGQEVMFDDMWHDVEVAIIGRSGSSRLLQLHAHDVFSACQFARGIKPRVEDPETGKRLNLDQGDMLFLTAHCAGNIGYHPDGTRYLCEAGTAALPRGIADLLYEYSGERLEVKTGAVQNASSFAGQYLGAGKGNFKFKAHLESSHRLIHNEEANPLELPGQTGGNSRIDAPEQLHGQKRLLMALQRAFAALPPEIVAEFKLPCVEVNRAIWVVERIQEEINRRTDHDLEGWIEAGLTTIEYVVAGIPVPAEKIASLDAAQLAAVQAVATPMPRKLSPREVFERGRGKLIRFRPEQQARILLGVSGREARVGDNHLITLEDASISPSPLRYLAHTFRPGDVYRVVVNPYDPSAAHLFDARERWMGVVKLWQAVPRVDQEALKARISEASQIQAELLRTVAARGTRQTLKRIADTEHNNALLDGYAKAQADLEQAADDALQNLL